MNAYYIAVTVFFVAYLLISLEKFHKTTVALFGAAIILVTQVLSQSEAFHSEEFGVDWNVVLLLVAMMLIVNIMKPTGLFEYLAIKSAKIAKGSPYGIMTIFSIVTAFASAFIDNVTTVLLITPVIIHICDVLEVDLVPYLITTALASNIGGTATLIGDPPNIMIASKAHLDFMAFVYHLAPVVLIIMALYILMIKIVFRKFLHTTEEAKQRIMAMDETGVIKDPRTVVASMAVLAVTIGAFIFHGHLNLQPATIALAGAALLLLVLNIKEPHHVLAECEWTSIFFFIGLFIIVGGIVKVGFVKLLAMGIVGAIGDNMLLASTVILWFSAVASAVIDNIPFVATMNPMMLDMGKALWPNLNIDVVNQTHMLPVWWALSLGACLGGNGTAIGASANVVVVGMGEKVGKKVSFVKFMVYAFPFWLMSIIVSNIYIWLRYFALR